MTGSTGVILWLVIAMALLFLEGITVQLVSIWFAIGTIPTMIVAGLGGGLGFQLLVFLITSVLVLLLGRPLLKKKIESTKQATNADRVIGMSGIVLQDINNLENTGRASANGLDWTARTENDSTIIPKDSKIKVLRIDGVKLIVEPLNK